MTLQVAFGLVGLAVWVAAFASTFAWPILIVGVYAGGVTGLVGWFLHRWNGRTSMLRWAIVTTESVVVVASVCILAIDDELTWPRLIGPNTLFPLSVIVCLLLPAAGRWFRGGE
ncbi:hypothetical protein [Nonomuraea aridisoli]|uniref:Uncharacterized protein n=1 Tax=Nonomuraea aridisoli TaxID=2070368 RepID=A0A2W2E2F4_9ACTN|nr:hypothetical protein [Nonomuraea aridisoli]PZG16451.1 hypothetical protein C1J01_20920 [Nonomuraea aridisoli]